MRRLLLPIAVTAAAALSLASSAGAQPQLTYVEGVVHASAGVLQTAGGRAEVVFDDGSVLHVDRLTEVTYSAAGDTMLRQGRVMVRTSPRARPALVLAIATVRMAPRGVYSVLYDASAVRLLVGVAVGHADIETPYGSAQVVGREMAVMLGRTSRPFATAYDPARRDSFELWSDQRMAVLAYGSSTAPPLPGVAESGAIVDRPHESSLTCSSYLAYDNPCWIVGTPMAATPSSSGPRSFSPGYAPTYAPAYGAGDHADPRARPPSAPRRDPPARPSPQPAPSPPPKSPDAAVKPLPRSVSQPPPTKAPPPAPMATPKPAGAIGRPQ